MIDGGGRVRVVVAAWCVPFAAVHLVWAAGGRAGLGSAADEADAALAKTWFAAYNLAAGALALVAVVTIAVVIRRPTPTAVRRVHAIARVGAAVLFARGAIGLGSLAVDAVAGVGHDHPVLLLLVEPWFVLGGAVSAYVARATSSRTRHALTSPRWRSDVRPAAEDVSSASAVARPAAMPAAPRRRAGVGRRSSWRKGAGPR